MRLVPHRRAEMVRLYVEEGLSLRAVGKRMDVTHSRVEQVLKDEGITLRSRGYRTVKAVPLESEIFADLTGHFAGEATVDALVDWLGEDREKITDALLALTARGKITYAAGVVRHCKNIATATSRAIKPALKSHFNAIEIPADHLRWVRWFLVANWPLPEVAALFGLDAAELARILQAASTATQH